MITEQRKVVKIVVPPQAKDESSSKLAKYFHDELKKRQQVDKV